MFKRVFVMGLGLMLILGLVTITQAQEKKEEKKNSVDIVFAIDVSGSMERIISAAQKKVWAIVNEMVKAKPTPDLRVGLIAYRGEKEECYGGVGFKVWDLSDDLDKVYENIMALKTDGGNIECVGRAIYEATNNMKWNETKDALKVVFILGNEPANQDTDKEKYGYEKTTPEAAKKGININTTYCKQGGEKAGPGWEEIAKLADGSFATIDISGKTVDIPTPHDRTLADLNKKLNETYIPFGKEGLARQNLQEEMDKKADKNSPSSLVDRAITKGGSNYSGKQGIWDLVDAMKNKDFKLEDVKKEDLPKEMQEMKLEEQKAHIEKKAKEREDVQKQIVEESKKRDVFIQEEMKKQKLGGDDTFDQTIINTLRKQAEKKGFKFEEEKNEKK